MNIEDYLEQENMKAYQLAKLCNIAPSTLYKVLNGQQRLSLRLAEHLEACTGGQITRVEALWPDYYRFKKRPEFEIITKKRF